MMAHYLPHESKSWHHPIRVAIIRLDQKAISPKKTHSFLIQICENPDLISKSDAIEVFYGLRSTKPKNFKTKNSFTRPHVKPQSLNDQRPSPLNLRKYARNFRTWTTPLDPSALDRQNAKISSPKMPTLATIHCLKLQSAVPLYPHASMCHPGFLCTDTCARAMR